MPTTSTRCVHNECTFFGNCIIVGDIFLFFKDIEVIQNIVLREAAQTTGSTNQHLMPPGVHMVANYRWSSTGVCVCVCARACACACHLCAHCNLVLILVLPNTKPVTLFTNAWR